MTSKLRVAWGVIGVLTGLLLGVASGTLPAQESNAELIDAVRRDDRAAVQTLLERGASPHARDESGTPVLMHAAAVASMDTMGALLAAGADVNVATKSSANPLMWATGDAAKTRLLLDRGAMVNARMRDGTTALVTAARRGNADVVRLLLARGADPKGDTAERTELLRVVFGERPDIRPVLASAGIDAGSLMPTQGPPLTTFPSVADAASVRDLLDLGVSPNPRGRFPILANAVLEGHLETVRLLLDRGADPNARGQHNVTPLMMAAAAPRPDPSIVRLLLEKGADVHARDGNGRSAVDWAVRLGDTPTTKLLQEIAGAPVPAAPGVTPAPVSAPRRARDAVSAALARLVPVGSTFYERAKCISCHHQTLPLMAMTGAAARGLPVETSAMAGTVRAILDVWNSRRENLLAARSRDGGGANELGYGLLALAEAGAPANGVTDAATANLISTQRSDGSWVFLDTRPPQADNSPIPFTAMAIRGLAVYGPPGLRAANEASRARALTFLRRAGPGSTQDEAFKLLGLIWARASDREVESQAQRLLALQRDDGGWGQLSTMASDAYATGQALYALSTSNATRAERAHQRGIAYLLRSQLEDGTWLVRSRAFGFQPYFESGFPHGVDQFISASATAWAAIALAMTL